MSRPTNPVPPNFSGLWILYPEDLPQPEVVARGVFNVSAQTSVEDHTDELDAIDVTDLGGAAARCA